MKSQITKYLPYCLVFLGLFSSPSHSADIKTGEQLAKKCTACHGAKGISNNPLWPSLAGQQPAYLSAQLKAFKTGSRKNPVMENMVSHLSEDDFNHLAAYFTSLKSGSAGGDPDLAKTGKTKFSMCAGCHGSKAEGRGIFPRLAGQHPEYIAKQLENFKNGNRSGGPMSGIASSLSGDDIAAIAAYLGSIK